MPRRARKSGGGSPAVDGGRGGEGAGASLSELGKELDTYSGAISSQLRTVNFGILGLVWVLLLRKAEMAWLAQRIPEKALLGVALASLLGLVLDLVQYLFAEKVVDEAFDRATKSPEGRAEYDDRSLAYRSQFVCYRAKLVLTFASVLACLGLIAGALVARGGGR